MVQHEREDWVVRSVRDRRHRRVPLSRKANQIPGMISPDERSLLAFLAEHAWRPGTCIVDGGAFLGASTRSLIDGLTRNRQLPTDRRPIIHSYDLFVANDYMVDRYLSRAGIGPGDSYLELFLEHLRPDEDLVEVHPGDVRRSIWSGEPISILFLDMIWSWDVNRFVMENFYRNLSTQGAFVVHQDYVYAWYPWLPISMEYFADHFEFVGYVPLASVVFRTIKPLEPERLCVDFLHEVDADSLMSLMTRAIERFSGDPRGVLECSKASLLRYLGRKEEARAHLQRIIEDYRRFEAPVRFAREIVAHIDSGLEPRVV